MARRSPFSNASDPVFGLFRFPILHGGLEGPLPVVVEIREEGRQDEVGKHELAHAHGVDPPKAMNRLKNGPVVARAQTIA